MPSIVKITSNACARSIYLLAILLLLIVNIESRAQGVELKDSSPERYSVKKGDTLWGIAGKYLEDPWRWPEIWQRNDQIENPHLIYPGDLLVLVRDGDGGHLKLLRSSKLKRDTVKLSPAIYIDPEADAIPTIPPDAIAPFLSAPLIVEEKGLEQAPYITSGTEDNIVLGRNSRFYARGLSDPEIEYYRIFRPARALKDVETGEVLGYEALHIGDAELINFAEISKLEVVKSLQEISPGDRLLKAPKDISLPHYHPRKPDSEVRGRIITTLRGIFEMGPMDVAVLSVGERDGIENGHVLRILRHKGKTKDPIKKDIYQLPDEQSGLLMVFRTFEKLSYGLILHATRAIHVNDTIETP